MWEQSLVCWLVSCLEKVGLQSREKRHRQILQEAAACVSFQLCKSDILATLSHTVPRAAEWHWATHQSCSLRQFHPGRWTCMTGSRSKRNTNETRLSSRSSGRYIFRRVVCQAWCHVPTIQALRRCRQQNWWGEGVQSQPYYLTRLRPAWATWSPPQTKWNKT